MHITSIVTYWKQMQLVRLDILKHSADVRCCRLYDNLLQRQSTWSRKFPAAVEHACATTVVEANPTPASPQNLLTSESESRSLQRHPSDRKRLLNWVSDIDTEQQLAKLRTLEIQGRWLEWTDVMHSDLSWRRLLHGLDDANLRFSYNSSQILPQRPTIYGDGESLRSTPVVHFVESRVRCVMF